MSTYAPIRSGKSPVGAHTTPTLAPGHLPPLYGHAAHNILTPLTQSFPDHALPVHRINDDVPSMANVSETLIQAQGPSTLITPTHPTPTIDSHATQTLRTHDITLQTVPFQSPKNRSVAHMHPLHRCMAWIYSTLLGIAVHCCFWMMIAMIMAGSMVMIGMMGDLNTCTELPTFQGNVHMTASETLYNHSCWPLHILQGLWQSDPYVQSCIVGYTAHVDLSNDDAQCPMTTVWSEHIAYLDRTSILWTRYWNHGHQPNTNDWYRMATWNTTRMRDKCFVAGWMDRLMHTIMIGTDTVLHHTSAYPYDCWPHQDGDMVGLYPWIRVINFCGRAASHLSHMATWYGYTFVYDMDASIPQVLDLVFVHLQHISKHVMTQLQQWCFEVIRDSMWVRVLRWYIQFFIQNFFNPADGHRVFDDNDHHHQQHTASTNTHAPESRHAETNGDGSTMDAHVIPDHHNTNRGRMADDHAWWGKAPNKDLSHDHSPPCECHLVSHSLPTRMHEQVRDAMQDGRWHILQRAHQYFSTQYKDTVPHVPVWHGALLFETATFPMTFALESYEHTDASVRVLVVENVSISDWVDAYFPNTLHHMTQLDDNMASWCTCNSNPHGTEPYWQKQRTLRQWYATEMLLTHAKFVDVTHTHVTSAMQRRTCLTSWIQAYAPPLHALPKVHDIEFVLWYHFWNEYLSWQQNDYYDAHVTPTLDAQWHAMQDSCTIHQDAYHIAQYDVVDIIVHLETMDHDTMLDSPPQQSIDEDYDTRDRTTHEDVYHASCADFPLSTFENTTNYIMWNAHRGVSVHESIVHDYGLATMSQKCARGSLQGFDIVSYNTWTQSQLARLCGPLLSNKAFAVRDNSDELATSHDNDDDQLHPSHQPQPQSQSQPQSQPQPQPQPQPPPYAVVNVKTWLGTMAQFYHEQLQVGHSSAQALARLFEFLRATDYYQNKDRTDDRTPTDRNHHTLFSCLRAMKNFAPFVNA